MAGAGPDDPEEEPAKHSDWNRDGRALFALPNVLVIPRAAYCSEESIIQAREVPASEPGRGQTGQAPHYPVNQVSTTQRGINVLKIFLDFERRPERLARFDTVLPGYSVSCIFADVMYRQNIMHSSIKPAFRGMVVDGGVLVNPGDFIVADTNAVVVAPLSRAAEFDRI